MYSAPPRHSPIMMGWERTCDTGNRHEAVQQGGVAGGVEENSLTGGCIGSASWDRTRNAGNQCEAREKRGTRKANGVL